MTPQLHDIKTVAERLSISIWQAYALCKSGELRVVPIGKRRLVSEAALVEYIERLEAQARGTGPPEGVISA